jgi:nicotinate-nucleotide adenylyltransferase
VALAQAAVRRHALDELLLMPTGVAPHKEIEDDPGREVRLEMARLAAAGVPRLSVSELETAREGPSYTYRTLELLGEERPDAELVLVMGADAAAELERWREPRRIVELARLAIAERAGVDRADVEAALKRLGVKGGEAGRGIAFVDMPEMDVSSTMVREAVRAGRPIRELVPETVAGLIGERGLYGG